MSAPSVGASLNSETEKYFQDRLTKLSPLDADIEDREPGPASCYAAVIEGLKEDALNRLLIWARRQTESIKHIICNGLRENISDTATKYLIKQLDCDFYPSCFPLYLRSKYSGDGTNNLRPIPRFTKKRLRIIANWARTSRQGHWALWLLKIYLERSEKWIEGTHLTIKELPHKLRRAISLISPRARPATKRKFVSDALKQPNNLTQIDRSALKLLGEDKSTTLEEDIILSAIHTNGTSALEILEGWLYSYRKNITITAKRINEWITLLYKIIPRDKWTSEPLTSNLFHLLASAWSFEGRAEIINRAEDIQDPERDFILSAFVLKLTGFNMSELSEETWGHVLDMYLAGEIEPYPSPGELATEAFIEKIVVPRMLVANADQREEIQRLLHDAGDALGRRFIVSEL